MKALAWYIDPNSIENKNVLKQSYPTGIKNGEILIVDTRVWYQEVRIVVQYLYVATVGVAIVGVPPFL